MTYEEAKAQRIHITIEYAKNDVERYLMRKEEPIPKCIALAIDALDKQIPKPPKITIHSTTDLNMSVRCPSCHGLIFDYDFCPQCGQAIKR